MQKIGATLAVMMLMALMAGTVHANFTIFDLSKDSMVIARGEFTGLQRTNMGDRLTLRCDEVIKGEVVAGENVAIEPFEFAASDEALGREVIVFFFPLDGKNYFMNHPFTWRSYIFETDDVATDGLDRNEEAIRAFLAINAPHVSEILAQLSERLIRKDLGYAGEYAEPLINAWKAELIKQAAWAGTRAARDAAKALCESELFKGQLTEAELMVIGSHVALSAKGELERAYMLELIRNQTSAHPAFPVQIAMLREETSQACVGKLSNLMAAVENRQMVLETVGSIASNREEPAQARINALQILQALADTDGLPHVHAAITGELEATDFNKDVMRRALSALRSTPDASSVPVLNLCLGHGQFVESWELQQRAWVAYSMVDTKETNDVLLDKFMKADTEGKRFWFKKLLPANKIIRKLIIIHHED
jgi:hypothetical protein